jgi:hypothetical protein
MQLPARYGRIASGSFIVKLKVCIRPTSHSKDWVLLVD